LFLASPIPYLEKMNVRLFNICTNSLGAVGGYVTWCIFRVFLPSASLQAFHQPSQSVHSQAQGEQIPSA